MTIGPAPMIRIDLMSVRLGIGLRTIGTKKGRAFRASSGPAQRPSLARERSLDQNRWGGKGGGRISGGGRKGHAILPVRLRTRGLALLRLTAGYAGLAKNVIRH